MQSLFDIPDPSSQLTLLDELEILDKALTEGDATPEQENRGIEIVTLCNDALNLKTEVERISKELADERTYRKYLEAQLQKKRIREHAYKGIDDVYKLLKSAAEHDAQAPVDEHYRGALDVLATIASDQDSCTCHLRHWHGDWHDTQCPIRIATEALPVARTQAKLESEKRGQHEQ